MKKTLVFLLLLFFCPVFSQNSLDDIENQADKFFKKEEYSSAYKLYSQLVSNFPKDPEFNYRLGVCMIYSEPDKKKCLPYLRFAAGNQEEEELPDVMFYLGKACHINYLFDEAIKHYNEFKSTASSSQLKKFPVDQEIKAASNGKRLLSNLTDLEVIAKTELPESDYFRNYKKIGGKLLVKPDDFKTGTDKKKKEKSVVFLPSRGEVVYFSSYGDNADNGKDIYTAYKLPSGNYSKPEKVKGINTEFDEDYPFLHPDGKTLYFASKGHNSMGGYDIFKSTFNEETNTWEPPVNMEFPINSPDDDYLFVTDSLETIAYFSTGRQSPPGKIDVLKVKTKRRPIDVIAIKGAVIPGTPEYSLKSTIEIKDLFSGSTLGTFASEETGEYGLELPNGAKLLFTVETPGLEIQSTQVTLPMASASKPFKQTISYDKGKLKILNYFDEPPNDESYLQYLKVIEKKARLDVSEGGTALQVAANEPPTKDKPADVNENKKPQISAEETTPQGTSASADPKKGLDNKQLAKMARQDAEESRLEAAQLNRDYVAANETGIKQKQEAEKKIGEANEAIAGAETISNEGEKKTALENANDLKLSAENDLAIAEKILTLAKSLDDDAKTKQKEADLNDQYAAELDKATRSKNNKESLAKLEELQKQINDLSGQKNGSETVVNSIKNDIEQKEKQIASVEEINSGIKANLEEIKVAIGDKENELAKTRKKSTKENISAQISELRADQEDKEKQISANEAEIKTLGEELTALKSELNIATKITSENIDATGTAATAEPVTSKTLQEKYKDKIPVADTKNRSSLEESTNQLNNFNKEIEKALTKNKSDLGKTKNQTAKKQITTEIKQLEATKKQNQQLIASNSRQLAELDKTPVQNTETARTTFDPLVAGSSDEAITKLDNLTVQLNGNDNENFDFNAYQDPRAQSLKVEADARINDAIAKQKKLKDDIAISKSEIQKSGSETSAPIVTAEQLNKEAEEIAGRAQKAREEAKTKQGSDKDKLLEEAKSLEDQANDKYIQAAGVTMNDNTAVVSANQENIQNLIRENKSSEADLNLAKSLNEEAKLAFRKAADIRTEANSLSNKGAKLGSFSNAEEKEAEAILKQQQAIEVLTKSNFLFKLKVPVTSTSTAQKKTEAVDLSSKLETVNTGLSELAAIKIESYQKLYEANDAEIQQLTSSAAGNQSAVDNTPSLKSDLISSTAKVEDAKTFKQKSDDAANPSEKLNNLMASIKKQNEAIKQLTALNASISQLAANSGSNPPPEANTPPAGTEPVNTPASAEETSPPANETTRPDPAEVKTVDLAQLALDTTTGQVLNYFDGNSPALRNSQANSRVKSAISQLKDFETQNSKLDEELTQLQERSDDGPVNTPDELNKKAEVLLTEAEPVNNRSLALKKEAESKEGEEKNYTLAQARELEIQAQDKMIEAANFKQQAHEADYKTNTNAINELLERLKTDNPDLSDQLQEKMTAYAPLKTQIRNLRDEANALNNKAAKLGAISNAEEKETELTQKQTEVLNELKKQYPDYVVKPVGSMTREEQVANLDQKKTLLREKQYAELTNLTNAFSLEYESSKNSVPADLSPAQQTLKQNAEDLNSESKRLLIQSANEKNESEKIKLLTLAARSGNAAVEQLNKLLPEGVATDADLTALSDIGNRLVSGNNEPGSTDTKITGNRNTRGAVKIDGLEVLRGNAYSNENPIPMDSKMEDGLVFRVQIGAFKTQIPNNAFKGLSPLNGETTTNGYFRYTAGNFNRIENANAVKNDLRNLGYRDAFVVVYYNGKRITLAEAMAMLSSEGKTIDPNAPQTAGITANANVPRATINTAIQESVEVTKELEQTNGLLYTIQVGVYTKQITKPQLLNLRPIFREQLTNGLFRYTAGIYNNPERLLTDKTRIVDLGVKDAFVSAYLNGKRIPFAEAKERQTNDTSIRMETENPVIFPEAAANPFAGLSEIVSTNVQPFTNEVKEYPAATPDNGIKTNEEGICFKVQIGAFSKQVPNDVAAKFSAIKTWPVENKQINGLFVYNVGNFSEPKFAKALKEELIALGVADAFITVYKDGQKLYGAAAESYLR